MGFFSPVTNLFKRSSSNGATFTSNPEQWLIDFFNGGSSADGLPVTLKAALSLSPFYAGVKILAETKSVLPFQLYQRDKNGVETLAIDHPLYNLVHSEPNEIQTNVVFTQAETLNTICKGRSFSKINFNKNGLPISMDLLKPENVKIIKVDRNLFFYHENHEEGIKETLHSWEVIHLLNMSFDGINGLNVVQTQKESLRKGINAQEFGNNYFANGTHNGSTIESPNRPPDGDTKTHTENFLKYWNKSNAGVGKAGQPILLWDGMQYKKTADNLADSMLLDVLKMNVQDASRVLRIPIEMIESENRSQSTTHEELMSQLKTAILPYLRLREAEYNKKLIPTKDKGKLFFKHNVKMLEKANVEGQMRMLETFFKLQMISPDDGLAIMDMPPRKDKKGGEYGLPFASNIKTEAKPKTETKSAKVNGVKV